VTHIGMRSMRRIVLLGLMVGTVGMTVTPTARAEPVRDLSGLPAGLQQYVPGSAAWLASPWMTSQTCQSRGGDFSIWTASVVRDTPDLLAFFQASEFGSNVSAEDRPRSDAIIQGYRSLGTEMTSAIPAGYCVDDLQRWAGSEPEAKPFGFPWGVTPGHQTNYYCTDRDPTATTETERNRWLGAERAMCDGFYVSCTGVLETEKNRCEAWNAFSDSYVREVELLRAKAINEHPAQGKANTQIELKGPGDLLSDASGAWLRDLALNMARAAASMMAEAMTFWVRADQASIISSPAIGKVQDLLRYIGIVLLVAGVMWQGILMMYRRKADPLISAGMGLLSFVGWSTLGGSAAVLVDNAGTALADQVLDESVSHFSATMGEALQANVANSAGAIFLLSLIVFFLGCIQWLLGFFRMGALAILLALIPTAAAGQLAESTKPWLRKVSSWCLALILYKPVAAVVFSIGFTLMSDGRDLTTVLVGMAVLALAVIAMPTMLRFFDWGGQRFVASGGGGGAVAAGAAASLLGGAGAVGLGRFMDRTGPGSSQDGGRSSGAAPVATAHAGDGPGGQATTGTTEASTASAASGAGTSSTVTSGASSGGAAAAAGPAGAVVAAANAARDTGRAAVDAASGAMTDGAPEGQSS
jgi:hypothetical protein